MFSWSHLGGLVGTQQAGFKNPQRIVLLYEILFCILWRVSQKLTTPFLFFHLNHFVVIFNRFSFLMRRSLILLMQFFFPKSKKKLFELRAPLRNGVYDLIGFIYQAMLKYESNHIKVSSSIISFQELNVIKIPNYINLANTKLHQLGIYQGSLIKSFKLNHLISIQQ